MMSVSLIDEVVAKCIPDARAKARLARMAGHRELSDWRANLVRELNSVVTSILSSLNGVPQEIFFHSESVNDLFVSRGFIAPPKKLKARLGMAIYCDNGHRNGFFRKVVEEGHDISRDAMDLIAEPAPDGQTYLCLRCAAPVALRIKDRDKWFVRAEEDWIG